MSVDEEISSCEFVVFMIVVKMVVSKILVMIGWNSEFINSMKIFLLLFRLIVFDWVMKIRFVKLIRIVLVIESLVYIIVIWCVVIRFLLECEVLKCVRMCGWLK